MAQFTLTLEQAIALVNREAADPELRAAAGAAVAALLLPHVRNDADGEVLQLVDGLLNHAHASLEAAVERQTRERDVKAAVEKLDGSGA